MVKPVVKAVATTSQLASTKLRRLEKYVMMEKLTMSVTMRDVARRAKVSIKTVSRVINDQGEISEETRQRVQVVIDELGYTPNLAARSLVTQRSSTVGLVISDITNPFFAETARGVQDVAREEGYELFVCNSDGMPQEERRVIHSLASHNVDGIIIFPYGDGQVLAEFARPKRPLVAINRMLEHPHISVVQNDLHRGAQAAVEHLISLGHRAIGMLAGSYLEVGGHHGARYQGYLDALAQANITFQPEWVALSEPVISAGQQAARALLTTHPEITALFCYNDLLAIGALAACSELGRHVPQNVAVVGFDDNQLAALVHPALTTVRIDKYELGRQAMLRLLSMLRTPNAQHPPIHLGVDLVIRESSPRST
jgi:LacI family transcriptional regulator